MNSLLLKTLTSVSSCMNVISISMQPVKLRFTFNGPNTIISAFFGHAANLEVRYANFVGVCVNLKQWGFCYGNAIAVLHQNSKDASSSF